MRSLQGFAKVNAAGFPAEEALYNPNADHDACGTGFVAKLDAIPQHSVIQDAARILINLEHRGAIGGDKLTGDGAGIAVQIPDQFFRAVIQDTRFTLPVAGEYAVGQVFLPTDPDLAGQCVKILNQTIEEEGCRLLGWRTVETNPGCLGELALSTMPQVRQVFIDGAGYDPDRFERKLYVIRRVIEKSVAVLDDGDYSQFYICSLSARKIVYKGMLTGTQLVEFYTDLKNENFTSAFAIVHQRFSTNTLPTWPLAQPFRYVAHNGEINTLRGNINRMRGREALISSDLFSDDIDKLKPIINEIGSDSSIFDNVLELLVMAGRSLPHALMMMIPEAWGNKYYMSEDKRAFYEYHAAIMEPWDGPAAMVVSDGRYIGATLDRNGLRPARYTVTNDGTIVLASETGVMNFAPENIRQRGRLSPGRMLLVDLQQHRIVPDKEIKAKISRQKPYRKWLQENKIELRGLFAPSSIPPEDPDVLLSKQVVFGYTREDIKTILAPMAINAQEPVGSMGDDMALAVLSDQPRLLFDYFKQLFAQVTNPPIDPLREGLVMSLMTFVGPERNLLEETPENCRMLKLYHPILTPRDMSRLRAADHPHIQTRDIDILFDVNDGPAGMRKALENVFRQADDAMANGATILILTDRNMDETHAPIPSLLAVAGLNHHMIRKGNRTGVGLIVEAGDARGVMHFSLLIGFGCLAICPYLAFQTIRELAQTRKLDADILPDLATDHYITAIKKGLLKTFSRMGISTVRSYFGAQIFECVGLSRDVVDMFFTNTPSRIGGVGLTEIAAETLSRHKRGYPNAPVSESLTAILPDKSAPHPATPRMLDVGGVYQNRVGGERHLYSPMMIRSLQRAVRNDDYDEFKKYLDIVNSQSDEKYITLRSLMRFKKRDPIPLDEVEPIENIMQRFVSSAMSMGSISKEAHETLAIAMNRIGAKSNSGEGGEDPQRFKPMPEGDWKNSAVKQVASGRFGVTTEYLVNAQELQIKMAQGAKPGEGGQLPGFKVSREIAYVRHTTPYVTLISPPPHHDIYSIEDLAQLIHDLKSVNPGNSVSVKLVSEAGVGTIAAGVAKAKADVVLISGGDGGTGASPLTSIKYAGLPWELGVAETQQILIRNKLRGKIRIQVDGQMRTGRDVVIAAMLGGEEFGFGSIMLVSLGCIMARKCHLNTCPVGVATQDERLRAKFVGKPEHAARFLQFIAQNTRETLAELGFRTLDEVIGRVDLLEQKPDVKHWKARKVDLSMILDSSHLADADTLHSVATPDEAGSQTLDEEILEQIAPAIDAKKQVQLHLPIRNIHRTVGTTISGAIAKQYGDAGLPDDTIRLTFNGSAGQSFGAFLTKGMTMQLEGDANDYLGKGMSGGKLIVYPPAGSNFLPHENVIVGNTVLYGATGGEAYIRGVAGERFAVRNSGAKAVVEGVGDHCCEYMTGGVIVVLGRFGNNFAAGMSGGMAFVYEESEMFDTHFNLDMVDLESVWRDDDIALLKTLLTNHHDYTGSAIAKKILDRWESHLPLFVKVMPIDYRKSLERLRIEEELSADAVAATEEVYD